MEVIATAVLSCLMLSYGCHGARGDYTGVVNSETANWQDARQHCQDTTRPPSSSSCDLSAQNPQQHEAFWNSLAPQELSVGSSYWVGAKVADRLQLQESNKPLIEEAGCYVKPDGLRTDVRSLRYNGPERCLTQCTSNIVAIQGTACYCLSGEQTTSLEQRPLEECQVYCNREAYRCGGDNSRISVYKIPDRTLYEKRGKSTSFFWRRSQNNEQEFILFTNKPGKLKKQFCVSPSGAYSSVEARGMCAAGGRAVSFEDGEVSHFLQATSSLNMDWRDLSFLLPLGYTRQLLWLDGEPVQAAGGRGACAAITYDGQRFSLVRKSCKAKLPSVCSCYTQSQTTEATTEQTTVTTTPVAPTMTTTTTEMTTTTETTTTRETTTTTETTTTPETTTMTTSTPETTTTTITTTTPETTTTSDTSTADTSTGMMTKTDAPEKTPMYVPGSSTTYASEKTTTSLPSTAMTYTWKKPSTANVSSMEEEAAGLQPDKDSNMLFPFSDMKENSDGHSRAEPPPGLTSGESTADEGDSTAAATTSIGLIVGTAVGAVALVILVVVVVVVMRRRKESSASLLQKKNKKPESSTSYPI